MRTASLVLSVILLGCEIFAQSLPPAQSGFTPGTPNPNPAAAAPTTPGQPKSYDPLLDLPPLPRNKVTLIGGTVVRLDEVMNRMVVRLFGTKQEMKVRFDMRTHFYRDGKQISEKDVKEGQRVYLDTMLNGERVFAKSIWIQTSVENGTARGQIMSFDASHNTLTLRDELSAQSLKLQLSSATVVKRGTQNASTADLVDGALVSLNFGPQRELKEVDLLATPGSTFTFAGRVTYLDLSRKLIAIDNRSDGKNYDVFMEAIAPNVLKQLHEGVNVAVTAVFDGNQYAARSVDLEATGSNQAPK